MIDGDVEEEELAHVALSGFDMERISKMSAAQWKEERKKRLRETVFKNSKLGDGGPDAKKSKVAPDVPDLEMPELASAPAREMHAPDVAPQVRVSYYQPGEELVRLGMSEKDREQLKQKDKETKTKLSDLHSKLSKFITDEKERPSNQSPELAELEQVILTASTLSMTRATHIVDALRARLPKHMQSKNRPKHTDSSKAGRLMLTMTGANTLDPARKLAGLS